MSLSVMDRRAGGVVVWAALGIAIQTKRRGQRDVQRERKITTVPIFAEIRAFMSILREKR
jgi:hypothetical protein